MRCNFFCSTAAVAGLTLAILIASVSETNAQVKVDKDAGTVAIPCLIAARKLPNLPDVYPIEVIATFAAPKGQKAHETVVTIEASPSEVHKALESLGLKAGKPARGEGTAAEGPEVKVFLDLPTEGGEPKRTPIEKCVVDRKTGKTLPALKWHFTGSILKQPDPTKEDKAYGADLSGTLIAVFPVTDETVLQSSLTMKEEPLIKLDTNKKVLPAEGTKAALILQVTK
jgi:hypothetical protein